jgi:2-keto-4-pentenoate hydratase
MSQTPGMDQVTQALLQARNAGPLADAQALASALQGPDDAYAVQARVLAALPGAQPGPAQHWKSGGPNRAAVLTHAPLPPAGVRASPADLRDLPFAQRLIEAEVALRLGRDVTPQQAADLTPETAAALVDAMTVSIEVVASRWLQGPKEAPALCKLADLQSHGALVLGEWVPYVARDWAAQACTVQIGSQPATHWQGTHTLQDPAWLLPTWLRHATREGATVPAGTVVTTGSWCGMPPAAAGDTVHVAFEGISQAQLQL